MERHFGWLDVNELEFRSWLEKEGYSKKLISDTVSRVKRIEAVPIHIDIDDEFAKDRCEHVFSMFRKKGENEEMRRINDSPLPVGKYHLSTYKYAISLYVKFLMQLD